MPEWLAFSVWHWVLLGRAAIEKKAALAYKAKDFVSR
jgi:hypothetical protein